MSEKANTVTKHPGMGAISGPDGATFRLWAPHAEKVYVTGTFNDWSETATPLSKAENGYWSNDVSKAKTGDEYRYLIYGPTGPALSHRSLCQKGDQFGRQWRYLRSLSFRLG